MIKRILSLFIYFLSFVAYSQEVRINEVASSNTIVLDEDGDSPDWIELYNYGSETVSLHNWGLSDIEGEQFQWTFPDVAIKANEYLLIWASDKDRSEMSFARTLINEGDVFKYTIPTSEIPQWTNLDFDDSLWEDGPTGIGYADGDDLTVVPQGTKSVFARKKFILGDKSAVKKLILDIDYDDAFVAYINGKEVARANINGVPPAFNAGTLIDHEAKIYKGDKAERFIVDNPQIVLNEGENVLCIQVHNISNTSSDLTLIPFLSAMFSSKTSDGIVVPDILELTDVNLHTNFKISSESETITLSNSNAMVIDEMLVENLYSDISYGVSVKNDNLVYFEKPTPAYENSNNEFLGTLKKLPVFSHDGGLVSNNIYLDISGTSNGETIRYTLDASEPTINSPLYSNPIKISENTVVRAKLFKEDYLSAFSGSRTFIFNASHKLPVISLVSDPYNFFDKDYGIYVKGDSYDGNFPHFGANFWEDWERPLHFSLYEEDGRLGAEFNAGVKIFGGWSRGNDQRSLSVFARSKYGTKEIDYPIFPDLPYQKYQSIVLRNSGNDWVNTMIRDISLTSLMEGADIEFQAHRSAVAYLNGEYWGIYNIREKINEHFIASKKGVDAEEIDLLELDGQIVEGDNTEYLELIDFVKNNSLEIDSNYEYVADKIDVDNFILYNVAQIYFNNTDWPGNNIKYWKAPETKWRWILYDTDFGFSIWNSEDYKHDALSFALEQNGNDWPNPPWSTLLFRKLIENETFRNKFINRFADELNTRFLGTEVENHIREIHNVISSEIVDHYNRWGAYYNYGKIEDMRSFARNRPTYSKLHIKQKFNISTNKSISLSVNNSSEGYINVNNNLNIKSQSWSGDYFYNIPITLKAVAEAGYEFSHWSGSFESTDEEIELDMLTTYSMKANFTPSDKIIRPLVINEINYNSSDELNGGDWIELYNPNSESTDLSNWIFKDNNDENIFKFPIGSTIEANSYLVISQYSEEFKSAYPEVLNFIGDFEFGLSGSGDAVRIYNEELELQDEVVYQTLAPWPEAADGEGSTLELISVDLDNSLAESWSDLNNYGSPGRENESRFNDSTVRLYPNPVENILYISGYSGEISYIIYNLKGELLLKGNVSDNINLSKLRSGNYVISLILQGNIIRRKIIKL